MFPDKDRRSSAAAMPVRHGSVSRGCRGDSGNCCAPTEIYVHLLEPGIVSFPVETSPWAVPDLSLIRRSVLELRALADREGGRSSSFPASVVVAASRGTRFGRSSRISSTIDFS